MMLFTVLAESWGVTKYLLLTRRGITKNIEKPVLEENVWLDVSCILDVAFKYYLLREALS